MKRLGWWLLYILWGGLVAVLITGILDSPRGGLRVPEELLKRVHLEPESSWMGIYLNGNKMGYVHSELEPISSGGYEIREYSRLSGSMMGASQAMLLRMTVLTDSALAMVSFEGSLNSDPYMTIFSGRVDKRVLSIKITAGGKTSERFIPAPEPLYLSQAIKPLLQAGRLGAGDSLKLAGFDPISAEMQELVVIGAEEGKHRLWGQDVTARKLTTRMAGFESTLYVDADGNTLTEFGPMGMVIRREAMEQALDLGDERGQADFLSLYAIKPKGSIEAPRRVKRVRLKLSGVDGLPYLLSDRQRLIETSSDTCVVEITAEPLRSKAYEQKGPDGYTRDAPFIESRDPQIIEAARLAVRGAVSRLDTLDRLNQWVFHAVKKQPSAGIPSALAVLRTREGDCNEHSVLFTALARSLGIPARIMLGVVYQAGSFYYHAWTAAWVDDCWFEFDPTFGQNRADAARVALAAGDMTNAIELVGIIGKLDIEIVEAE